MGGLSKGSVCLLTMMPAATTFRGCGCGAWGATSRSCSGTDSNSNRRSGEAANNKTIRATLHNQPAMLSDKRSPIMPLTDGLNTKTTCPRYGSASLLIDRR
jgi:hypothetical protein